MSKPEPSGLGTSAVASPATRPLGDGNAARPATQVPRAGLMAETAGLRRTLTISRGSSKRSSAAQAACSPQLRCRRS
jgi:hypothetical protein